MRLTPVKNPDLSYKVWERKYLKDGEIKRSLGFVSVDYTLPDGIYPLKNYLINGKIYSYMSDKRLYVESSGSMVRTGMAIYPVAPVLCPVLSGGDNCVLSASPDFSLVLGDDDATPPAIDSNGLTVYNGMLFTFKGRVLKFSESFNYTTFTVGLDLGGYYKTEDFDGDIIAMKVVGDELFLLCKHSFIKITAFVNRTEFTAKRIPTPYFSALPDTAVFIGDTVYFVSDDDRFIAIKGGNMSFPETTLFNRVHTQNKKAVCYGDVYILPITVNGIDEYFCYSSSDKKEYFIPALSAISDTGGVCYDSSAGTFFMLTDKLCIPSEQGFTEDFDFGTENLKSVFYILVTANGNGELALSGDFGTKTLKIGKKYNQFYLTASSRNFTITVLSAESGFSVEKIKFKYTVYGG